MVHSISKNGGNATAEVTNIEACDSLFRKIFYLHYQEASEIVTFGFFYLEITSQFVRIISFVGLSGGRGTSLVNANEKTCYD